MIRSWLCPCILLQKRRDFMIACTVHIRWITYVHFWCWRLVANVRFEVFTAATIKNGVFLDATPCGSCKNRRFGGTRRLHHQGDKNRWTKNVAQRASVASYGYVLSSPILVTLLMKALSSSETSVLTRPTRRSIQEDVIFHWLLIITSVLDFAAKWHNRSNLPLK
jgi:hypothetical protein